MSKEKFELQPTKDPKTFEIVQARMLVGYVIAHHFGGWKAFDTRLSAGDTYGKPFRTAMAAARKYMEESTR